MDKKLLHEIAVSVINSGLSVQLVTDSDHTLRCRNIIAILNKQVNLKKPFYMTCQELLLTMNQKPTTEDVDFFAKDLSSIIEKTKQEVYA